MDVVLRPASAQDGDLLLRVYASTRDDLMSAPWDEATRGAVLRQQATAQDVQFRSRWPDARSLVVTLDEHDVGRLSRASSQDELRLLDIALLPPWRGRGIGTRLVRDLVDEARREGLLLSLHVALDNPARRLYERLGLRVTAQDDVVARMELRPS